MFSLRMPHIKLVLAEKLRFIILLTSHYFNSERLLNVIVATAAAIAAAATGARCYFILTKTNNAPLLNSSLN